MSKQLIESIIDDNLVEANAVFKNRINEILECKLYEAKRMLGALNEVAGGLTKADIEARKKAGYRRASEVLGSSEIEKSPATQKLAAQEKSKSGEGDITSMMGRLGKEWKKAPFGERRKAVRMVRQAAKKFAATQAEKPSEAPKAAETPKATETPRQMPPLTKKEPPREMPRFSKTGSIRKIKPFYKKAPEKERMEKVSQSAERLAQRGHSDPYGKIRSLKTKRILSKAGKAATGGLAALRHITRAIQDSSGGVIE